MASNISMFTPRDGVYKIERSRVITPLKNNFNNFLLCTQKDLDHHSSRVVNTLSLPVNIFVGLLMLMKS